MNIVSDAVSAVKILATLPVAIASFLVLSIKHDKSDDPIEITNDRTPVLLLHGSNANQKQWYYFRKVLQKNMLIGHVFAVNMNQACRCDDHDRDILDYAHTVHDKIVQMRERYREAGFDMSSIILVGNSMGGLVAGAYCISDYITCEAPSVKIKAVITISTPWKGSPWADYFCDTDIYPEKYFCTNSIDRQNLVEKMLEWSNRELVPIYNYGSKFDILVPISRSILSLPEDRILKDNRNDHWTTMMDGKLAEEISARWISPHVEVLSRIRDRHN